nr:hypothetical protein [Plesiomonas shigelloides]
MSRGGVRVGAGRKKGEPTKMIRVPESIAPMISGLISAYRSQSDLDVLSVISPEAYARFAAIIADLHLSDDVRSEVVSRFTQAAITSLSYTYFDYLILNPRVMRNWIRLQVEEITHGL